MVFALLVAVVADGLQLLLGPLGWFAADQIIDLIAMLLTVYAIGFHIFLLPTFVLELFPAITMLPTWTGCVIAVIAWRKRAPKDSLRPVLTSNPPKLTDGQAPPVQPTANPSSNPAPRNATGTD